LEAAGGERMATQLYWPPESGIMEESSPMTRAWVRTPRKTIGKVITEAVGPPLNTKDDCIELGRSCEYGVHFVDGWSLTTSPPRHS
jgi:hypothetical protein